MEQINAGIGALPKLPLRDGNFQHAFLPVDSGQLPKLPLRDGNSRTVLRRG